MTATELCERLAAIAKDRAITIVAANPATIVVGVDLGEWRVNVIEQQLMEMARDAIKITKDSMVDKPAVEVIDWGVPDV